MCDQRDRPCGSFPYPVKLPKYSVGDNLQSIWTSIVQVHRLVSFFCHNMFQSASHFFFKIQIRFIFNKNKKTTWYVILNNFQIFQPVRVTEFLCSYLKF